MPARRSLLVSAVLFAVVALLAGAGPARAQVVTDQTLLVSKAETTVERLRTDPNLSRQISEKLAHARAVLIVPDLVKAGLFVGGEYGSGVLLARTPSGRWSGPAFYSVAGASLGFQAGVQDAETMLIIMTEGGLSAVMNNRLKLGADAGIALVLVGAGAEASTTANAGADIYAFSDAAGLYAGLSLEGSAILPRDAWNASYYGSHPTPRDIIALKVDNRQSDRLRDELAR